MESRNAFSCPQASRNSQPESNDSTQQASRSAPLLSRTEIANAFLEPNLQSYGNKSDARDVTIVQSKYFPSMSTHAGTLGQRRLKSSSSETATAECEMVCVRD